MSTTTRGDEKEWFESETMPSQWHPNAPHPSLEYPLLYFVLKCFPTLQEWARSLYKVRWELSYPLQRRIPFSKYLRKVGITITWGELLLLTPFLIILIQGTITSFVNPSVTQSGIVARLPLAICFLTANHNSLLTLLLGIPFERVIKYHKLSGYCAFINGILHTYVAFALDGKDKGIENVGDVFEYTVDGQVNTSGTMLLTIMFAMIVTSMPLVRRIVFEVFYYFHIGFAMAMVFCAFYHSGIFVVILASILWGGDLFIRRVIMTCRYPRKATIKRLTDTVIEVSIPKTKNLDYNCGQYMWIAVPELSVFQWHPISISSSPYQNDLTFHIRKTGSARSWTSGLYNLAEKRKEISVWLEGPYGSLGVDLTGDRYKMVMFLSGGIGVTPMQSVCNQMMYEHEWGERRGLKKIWFIWTARDPKIMENMEITRHSIKPLFFPPLGDDAGTLETMNATSEESMNATPETMTFGGAVFDSKKGFTASSCTKASLLSYMLLTEMPFSQTSDDELERQFPLDDFLEEDNNFKELEKAEDDQNQSDIESFRTTLTADRFFARNHIVPSFIYNTIHGIFAQNVSTAPNKKVIKNEDLENTKTSTGDKLVHDIKEEEEIAEYNDIEVPKMSSPGGQVHDEKPQQKPDHEDTFNHTLCSYATGPKKHILQLDCYLTTKEIQEAGLTSMIPFAHRGRPDFKQIFLDMRKEAIKQGENRVAVCVCAPYRIVQICKMACIKYSNKQVRFDCHTEAFGGKAFGGNS